jgi:hypothetical protein
MRNRREPQVAWAQEADWKKRNESVALRENFINSGISKPFNGCSKLAFAFRKDLVLSFETQKLFSLKTPAFAF